MAAICQAAEAEKIIRETGRLIGGTFVLGRPIDATGAVVNGNTISFTEAYRAEMWANELARLAAIKEREARQQELRDLGVMFEPGA
jgi:hypothetical protein